jgi:hypothetical protein
MPKTKLSSEQLAKLNDELCSVCLVELEDSWLRKTICGHVFHQDCLD